MRRISRFWDQFRIESGDWSVAVPRAGLVCDVGLPSSPSVEEIFRSRNWGSARLGSRREAVGGGCGNRGQRTREIGSADEDAVGRIDNNSCDCRRLRRIRAWVRDFNLGDKISACCVG